MRRAVPIVACLWRPWTASLLCGALAAVALSACSAEPAATTSAPSTQSAVPLVLSTPKDAVRTMLLTIQDLRAAHRQGDRSAVHERLAQLRALAARETILGRFNSYGRPAVDPEALLTGVVQDWAAMVGYYADHLLLEQMRVERAASDNQAHVLVVGTSDRGDAYIRVECLRGDDGQWRIGRVEFTAPASQPATAPTP